MQDTPRRPAILHAEPDGAAGPAALGLHEESSDPGGCKRFPENLRLLNETTGELVRGRCASPNKCEHCAHLAMMEHAEVLGIDAMTTGGPTIVAVLGTRSTSRKPSDFYEDRRQLVRGLKRRWPNVQYAALCEFTTGMGPKSGGRRRPHWNLLIKGIPEADVDQARDVLVRIWCDRVDALPKRQYVATIRSSGGLMRYLARHFGKQEQAPPAGWSGHRFLHSRGYFPDGIKPVRAQARDQLGFRRALWHVQQLAERQGVDLWAWEIDDLARALHEAHKSDDWADHLVQLHPLAGGSEPATARRPPFAALAARLERESTPGAGRAPSRPKPASAATTAPRTAPAGLVDHSP